MALCRCKELHNNPKGRNGNLYIQVVEPIGYPNTSSICGIKGCPNSGLIWLNQNEKIKYDNEERIFEYANNTTKIKVK